MNGTDVRVLEAIDLHGGLRVEFFRVGLRWAHRLLAVENEMAWPLLESVEGDDRQPFPPSPALQQLALQQRDDGVTVALLIGMAGKNHWSVGVEAFPLCRRIRFDVACRNQPCSAGQLGSAYKTLTPWRWTESGRPAVDTGRFQCALIPQASDQGACIDVVGPPADPIMLRAAIDCLSPTQRWCYEFQQSEL